ncbi:MAG: tetratricopeptide repeat protein [Opitutales bacterium]
MRLHRQLLTACFCGLLLVFATGAKYEAPGYVLKRADQLYQQKDYNAARELLKKAREKYPRDARVFYNEGTLEFSLGNYSRAIELFGQARAKTGDDRLFVQAAAQMANAYVRRGESHLLAGDTDAAEADWWKAHQHYHYALNDDPQSLLASTNAPVTEQAFFDLYLYLADRSIESSGILDGPIRYFDPDAVQALKSALLKLDQAEVLRPAHPEVIERRELIEAALAALLADLGKDNFQKAENYVTQQKWAAAESPAQKAVDAYKDALAFKPEDRDLRARLAEAQDLLAEVKNRLGELKRASADNTAQQPNVHPMAEPHLLNQAMQQFEGALDNKPDFPRAQQNLDSARQRMADLLEARGDQAQDRAENRESQGQGPQPNNWNEALRNFTQAQHFNPDDAGLQQKAANAEKNLFDALKQAGQQEFDKSQQELDPEKAMAQMDQAVQNLSQASNMQPGDQEVQEMLAEAQQQWQQMRRKMEAFRQMQLARGENMPQPGQLQPGGFRESVAFAEGQQEDKAVSERWAKFNTEAMRAPVRDW